MKHIKYMEEIYIKPFSDIDDDGEDDLIDYLQEFFDTYSIKRLENIKGNPDNDNVNNYIIYHQSLSIDIYNDPNRDVYKNLQSIQSNIEKRLGYKLNIELENYGDHLILYNIQIYRRNF